MIMTIRERVRTGWGPRTFPQNSSATVMDTGTRMTVRMKNGVPVSSIEFSYPGRSPLGPQAPERTSMASDGWEPMIGCRPNLCGT